jgi:hypothetical protein
MPRPWAVQLGLLSDEGAFQLDLESSKLSGVDPSAG